MRLLSPVVSLRSALPLLTIIAQAHSPAAGRQSYLAMPQSVEAALQYNLDLRIERLEIAASFAGYEVARAEFDPSFFAQGNYRDSRSPIASSTLEGAARPEFNNGDLSLGIDHRLPTGADLSLSSVALDRRETNSEFSLLNPEYASAVTLSLRQPLLKNAGFDANLAPLRIAKLNIAQSNLALQAQALEVMRQAEIAYWLCVTTEKAVEIRQRSVHLARRIVTEVTERAAVDQATRIDRLEAEAGLVEREELLLDARRERDNAIDLLYRVMGTLLDDGDAVQDTPAFDPLPLTELGPQDSEESFGRALNYAPSYLLQKNREYEREIVLKQALRDRLPDLDLTAASGISGRSSDAFDSLKRSSDADGLFWQVGFIFRIPWGSRAERARLQLARIDLEREKLSTTRLRQDLYADIRAASREVTLSAQRLRSTEVSLVVNREKFEEQIFRRERQQSTIRDVLEAQEEADAAELRHLQARLQALQAVTLLAQFEGTLPSRYRIALASSSPSSG
ncbi:MAG TPA: TolC family protein [Verrucomicrobiales bacterium]|nr:TolC family protein [Verrucomicrobiales bacterium]